VHRAPGDVEARSALHSALRRIADLGDHERWGRADAASQDAVVDVVSRLQGEGWEHARTATYAVGDRSHRVATLVHKESRVEFQLLPGGSFQMGGHDAPSVNHGLKLNEQPCHEVLVQPLLLGRVPLVQSQWDLKPATDDRRWAEPQLPMEGVTWDQSQGWLAQFADKLRLPSESEWEYACRAGTQGAFFWGDEAPERYAWFGAPRGEWRTYPPADHSEVPNAFGLVDMAGNVAEWCADHYASSYRGAPCDGSPRRLSRGDLRVVRGGDSFNLASHCRSAARNFASRHDAGAGIGFRVACDVQW
jgi:formylglycine-generating enzyme required for sulfatase activity